MYCLAEQVERLESPPRNFQRELVGIALLQLVSARYERASMIVTSNKPFSCRGEVFGDEVVAAAMIDRVVHHAEILGLRGDSHRLRDKAIAARPRPALVDEG